MNSPGPQPEVPRLGRDAAFLGLGLQQCSERVFVGSVKQFEIPIRKPGTRYSIGAVALLALDRLFLR